MQGFDTLAVHGPGETYEGAVSFPIFQTSTYEWGAESRYSYSRCSYPTRGVLEETIALMEEGTDGFAFSSGLAAINAVFSLLEAGNRVLVSDDLYGGTYRLIEEVFSGFGISFSFVNTADLTEVEAAMTNRTKLLFVETPTNPMMKVAAIEPLAALAHENGCLLAVDNTFLTPFFQRPLSLGADIVIHSATKFLSGHHDTISGLVVVKDAALAERLSLLSRTLGGVLSPFDSWLTLRGIQTLPLRMRRHQENAFAAASFLKEHPDVAHVNFPGLPEHPQYETMKKQATGFGGVLSFTLKEGVRVERVLRGGNLIRFAESLGGTTSLITYPLTQTHASIPEKLRERIGITPYLLRLSVGLEDSKDILADLAMMLEQGK